MLPIARPPALIVQGGFANSVKLSPRQRCESTRQRRVPDMPEYRALCLFFGHCGSCFYEVPQCFRNPLPIAEPRGPQNQGRRRLLSSGLSACYGTFNAQFSGSVKFLIQVLPAGVLG
jgi:hypothetical protein